MGEISSVRQGAVQIKWITFMKYLGFAKAGTAFPAHYAT